MSCRFSSGVMLVHKKPRYVSSLNVWETSSSAVMIFSALRCLYAYIDSESEMSGVMKESWASGFSLIVGLKMYWNHLRLSSKRLSDERLVAINCGAKKKSSQ